MLITHVASTSSHSVPDLLWETQGQWYTTDTFLYSPHANHVAIKDQARASGGQDGQYTLNVFLKRLDEVHVDGRNASTYFEPSQPPQTSLNVRDRIDECAPALIMALLQTRTPVPQRTYQKKQGGEPSHPNPVFFHAPDNTPINLGAVRDNVAEMSGAKEVAFPGKERQRPSIRIQWPGSKYEDFEIQVHFKKGMTKEELGKNVLLSRRTKVLQTTSRSGPLEMALLPSIIFTSFQHDSSPQARSY